MVMQNCEFSVTFLTVHSILDIHENAEVCIDNLKVKLGLKGLHEWYYPSVPSSETFLVSSA